MSMLEVLNERILALKDGLDKNMELTEKLYNRVFEDDRRMSYQTILNQHTWLIRGIMVFCLFALILLLKDSPDLREIMRFLL